MALEPSQSDLKLALQQMDDYEFEHLIADLWNQRGWETEVSEKSSDRGIDVFATRDEGGFQTEAVVQAKRYKSENKVGSPEVQQYASLRKQEDADLAIVVTTSDYSTQAIELAGELNLKLIDGDSLVQIIQENDSTGLLENYGLVDVPDITTTENHSTSDDDSNSEPDWWRYGATPGEASGDWWKVVAVASIGLMSGPFAFFFGSDSIVGLGMFLFYIGSGLLLLVSLYKDAALLRKRDIWRSWWWSYGIGTLIFGYLFIGFLPGVAYLYRRHRIAGKP